MKKKKYNFNRGVLITSISVIVVGLFLGSLGLAQTDGDSAKESLLLRGIDWLLSSVEEVEVVVGPAMEAFGAAFTESQNDIATSTTPFNGRGSISLWDALRYGDDPLINKNSLTEKFLFQSCNDATSTLIAIENREGKTIYPTQWGIELTGLSTTTIQMFVGTSSSAIIEDDRVIGVPDVTDQTVALGDDILVTDGSLQDATSTEFITNVLWSDSSVYNPKDAGYGTNLGNVPVHAGEFIGVKASTTKADGTMDQFETDEFDCNFFLRYNIFK